MAKVLSCWKDIARFLDRGVRTVQRWEQEQDLPVHRIGTGPRSPVFAFESELMAWLVSRTIARPDAREMIPSRPQPAPATHPLRTYGPPVPTPSDLSPHSKWRELRVRHEALLERNRQLAADQILRLSALLENLAVARSREPGRTRPAA